MTIQISLLGIAGAMVLGLIIAVLRASPIPIFQRFAAAIVSICVNTPLTLVVFFCFFVMFLLLGVRLTPPGARNSTEAFAWGVVAIAIYHSGFVAEAIRSGINTVPVGQAEAARAIGLTTGQSLREIILPQALRGAIAPLGNTVIALTKNTTVLATIGVAEASYQMNYMLDQRPDVLYLIFIIMAIGFVILTLPVGVFFTWLSRRMAVAR
jgi:glutamate transport system permease protein